MILYHNGLFIGYLNHFLGRDGEVERLHIIRVPELGHVTLLYNPGVFGFQVCVGRSCTIHGVASHEWAPMTAKRCSVGRPSRSIRKGHARQRIEEKKHANPVTRGNNTSSGHGQQHTVVSHRYVFPACLACLGENRVPGRSSSSSKHELRSLTPERAHCCQVWLGEPFHNTHAERVVRHFKRREREASPWKAGRELGEHGHS
ncbi:hypothetical protein F4803DRAFT_510664 [Xylaria telfairii]|nr:hypothetical protein F4803DRAFT_510664 [Xylaria telfairii]